MKTLFAPTSASKTDMAKPLSALIEEASFADTKDEESVMALEGLLHQADIAENKLVRLQTLRQIGKTRGFDKPILEMAASEGLVISAELAAENFSLSVRPSSTRNALAVAALDKKEIALAQEGITTLWRKIRNFFAESLDNFFEAQKKYKDVLSKSIARLESAELDEEKFKEKKVRALRAPQYATLFKGLAAFGPACDKFAAGTIAALEKTTLNEKKTAVVGGKRLVDVLNGLYKTAANEMFANGFSAVQLTEWQETSTGRVLHAETALVMTRSQEFRPLKSTIGELGYTKSSVLAVLKAAESLCANATLSSSLKKVSRSVGDAIRDAGGTEKRDEAVSERPDYFEHAISYRKAVTVTTRAINAYRGEFKDVMREVTTVAAAAVASIQK